METLDWFTKKAEKASQSRKIQTIAHFFKTTKHSTIFKKKII